MISSCEKVKMLYLDFIRYMVSYVSDLIMDWPERIFSTISHPIFNQASRDHPKYIGTLGGGTERPGQEGTITFSNSWGEAKIYGFELPVVNFPFLGSNITASSAYGVYIQSWSATSLCPIQWLPRERTTTLNHHSVDLLIIIII
jgi:hypothetical protein